MSLLIRVLALLALLQLQSCCAFRWPWSSPNKYRVQRENPYLPTDTKFIFFPEIVAPSGPGSASEPEQQIFFKELEGALSQMARQDELKLVSRSEKVEEYLATLTPMDFREDVNNGELGEMTNAQKVVRVRLLEWVTKEGRPQEKKKIYSSSVEHSRSDLRSYNASVSVYDFLTGTIETIPLKLPETEWRYTASDELPKPYDRARELDRLSDHLIERVVEALSPFEVQRLLLYSGYEIDIPYFLDVEGPCSEPNLRKGMEAAEGEHWDVALVHFLDEWKLVEKDENKSVRARVQWNLAITYRYLQRYAEALQAAEECERLDTSRKRRSLVAELLLLAPPKEDADAEGPEVEAVE